MYLFKSKAGACALAVSVLVVGASSVPSFADEGQITAAADVRGETDLLEGAAAGEADGDTALGTPAGARGDLAKLFKTPKRSKSDLDRTDGDSDETGSVLTELSTDSELLEASETSALDAANASIKRLQELWPDSAAAKFDAYRSHVLKVQALEAEIEISQAVLAEMDPSLLSLEDLTILVAREARQKTQIQTEIAQIKTALNAVGGIHDVLEAELAQARVNLARQAKKLNKIAAAKVIAANFRKHQDFINQAQVTLEECDEIGLKLLADASDRPVTQELIAETHELMGLAIPKL